MSKLPEKVFNKPVVFLSISTFAVMVGFTLYFSYKLGYLDFIPFLSGKPRPGSCLILQEKYCDKGVFIHEDEGLIFYAFKLPEGTPLFSPFAGGLSHTPSYTLKSNDEEKLYGGSMINSSDLLEEAEDPRRLPVSVFAYIYNSLPREDGQLETEVIQGDIVGRVSSELVDVYGDYNLMVSFSKYDSEKDTYSVNEELLKDLFD